MTATSSHLKAALHYLLHLCLTKANRERKRERHFSLEMKNLITFEICVNSVRLEAKFEFEKGERKKKLKGRDEEKLLKPNKKVFFFSRKYISI
jgi:hypothetical protein